jgi:ATP-binding cassette subfamily F protein 3
LFTQPDLLLLDEPTNHLDLEASLWLEDYLRRYDGTVLLVSHDRGLLNRVVGEILHLEGGKLTLYSGGYDRFEETRRIRLEQVAGERTRQEAQRAHIQKFVDRFRYKATKARQAQSRLKMLERLQPIAEHREEGTVNFAFPDPVPLAPPLYTIDNVVVGYDDKAVLSKLSLRLDADDRIALLGANGNGKSTLMKLLAGRLAPLSGYHSHSRKLQVGYFAQHQADELDLKATPVVEMSRRRPRDLDVDLRKHLGSFGFSQERADTQIGNLSGGEKARLLFALMTSEKPHILLLDEPTNHLDVQSRQALIQAINSFAGAVVIVSHDPHVIELTADRLWLVADGRVTDYDGDMDDYRKLLLSKRRAGNGAAKEEPALAIAKPAVPPADKKEQRRLAAERREALGPLRNKLQRAEKNVAKLESQKAKIIEAMADPALYDGDKSKLVDLQRQHGYLDRDLAEAEAAWLVLQEEWDAAQVEAGI